MSVRRLARLLHQHADTQSEESWRRTIYKYLDADNDGDTVPSPRTAALLAELLDEPADYFIRPQARTLERERLLARIAELEEENRRLRGDDENAQPG